MATIKEILVPDIGGATNVDVIEILVKPGDQVAAEASLITLEGDKATMEIPAPFAGTVDQIKVKVGDKVSEGSLILTLKVAEAAPEKNKTEKPAATKIEAPAAEKKAQKPSAPELKQVVVPDIGGAQNVDVIEVNVKPGDDVKVEQGLITLEGDKATMEIPSPYAGKIKDVKVKSGDKVSQGSLILTMEAIVSAETAAEKSQAKTAAPEVAETKPAKPMTAPAVTTTTEIKSFADVHAGPAVRQLARELGVDLPRVKGTGLKGRIQKEDLYAFVKAELQKTKGMPAAGGIAVPPAPVIDFSKFGAIEVKPLNKIKRLTGINVHRSWVTVPHVTQFEEADITEMEAFRQTQKGAIEAQGAKLTPLIFIMKAVVAGLKEFPIFNSSLDPSGENLIMKKYYNIGIAVDTPNGLVVPVIRDVDNKGILELAKELGDISVKAREKGLSPADMAGGCFTISSLGGIGGTGFTPIVNTPDVAILGVSKSSMKPVYQNNQFVPRLILPLSLSYDHRVVDGADGARFIVYLANCLKDIRTLLF